MSLAEPKPRGLRGAVILVPLFLLAAAASPAGAPQSAGARSQERTPSFSSQADLVLVDAVVLDAKGNPVEGLTQDDFVVREDGLAVPIVRFEAVNLPESAPSETPRTRFVSTNTEPATAPATRSFVIVFDDAQLSRATGERARGALIRFVETGLRDQDEVLLATTASSVWWSTRLSEGRRDLLALLASLEGRRPVHNGADRISDYEAMRLYLNRDQQVGALVSRRFYENGVLLDSSNQAAAEANRDLGIGDGRSLVQVKAAEVYLNAKARNLATLRTLERVAVALAQGTGRKAVLLVSDGFVHDPSLPEFRDVVRAMSRANGAVYFLDARGLPGTADFASAEVGHATEERDVSTLLGQAQLETEGAQSVAADTGGYSLRNPNDLTGGMERVARESRAYYLLGYVSPANRRDGKFRKIHVELRRPGLEVRARKGYYAPGNDKAPPHLGLDPAVRQALDSPYALGSIPLRLATYSLGPAASQRTSVLLVADIDPKAVEFRSVGQRAEAKLDSYVVVTPRDGGERTTQEKTIELSLPPEVRARLEQTWLPVYRSLELGPGAYQARFLVRDAKAGRIGTVRHEFEVSPQNAFRLSTPILTDSLQADPGGGPPRPVPLARRSFASGSNLAYLFEVYGAAKQGAGGLPNVSSRYALRKADGTTLVESPPATIPPGPQGELARQVALSLRGAAPGDYAIVLTVRDQVTGKSLELVDSFSVSPPPPGASSGRP